MANVIQALLKLAGDASGAMNALRQVEGGLNDVQAAGRTLQNVGGTLSTTLTPAIVGLGAAATKAAIDYESGFAGVEKTVDGLRDSTGELTRVGEELYQGFRDLAKEIPATHKELTAIGEAAGQLGIETKNILDFTRVMADLGETTNLASEEAAMSLAQFANITGMAQTDFDRLGASIVDLGNNMATTEADIVEMAQRIAGAGETVGMTESDILGFAAALSSVGINAQAGGSAISRVMVTMAEQVAAGGAELQELANVSGMTAQEFVQAWEDDPARAIASFVDGLGNLKQAGGDVFAVLDNLEMSELRTRDALLRMANAQGIVVDGLDLAADAWEENTALTEEAEKRYRTTAAQFEILKNKAVDVGITLGNVILPAVQDLLDPLQSLANRLAEMDEGTAKLVVKLGGLAAALGPATWALGSFLRALGSIVGAARTVRVVLINTSLALEAYRAGATAAEVASIGLAGKLAVLVAKLGPLAAGLGIAAGEAYVFARAIRSFRALRDAWQDADSFTDKLQVLARGLVMGRDKFEEWADGAEDTSDAVARSFKQVWEDAGGMNEQLSYSDSMMGTIKAKARGASKATDEFAESAKGAASEVQKQAEAVEEAAEAQERLSQKLEAIKLIISGPIRQANEEYVRQEEEILSTISELEAELSEYERKNGMLVGSQEDLVIAQADAQDAADRLAEAQQNLADNTDPEKQLELEAAVARAQQAVAGANKDLEQAGPHHVSYRSQIDETKAKLEEWRGKLYELAEAHRESIQQIILQMLEAKLAQSGWSQEAIEVYAGFARAAGLMDQKTSEAWTSVGQVVNSTHTTTEEKVRALIGITDRFVRDALGPEAEALLYASDGAEALARKLDDADTSMGNASGSAGSLQGDVETLGGVFEDAKGKADDLAGAVNNIPDHKTVNVEVKINRTGWTGLEEDAFETNSPKFKLQSWLENLVDFADRNPVEIALQAVNDFGRRAGDVTKAVRSAMSPGNLSVSVPNLQAQLAGVTGGGGNVYEGHTIQNFGMDSAAVRILVESLRKERQ